MIFQMYKYFTSTFKSFVKFSNFSNFEVSTENYILSVFVTKEDNSYCLQTDPSTVQNKALSLNERMNLSK